MTASEIRQAFLDFMAQKGHAIIPRASLVPQNDPTTLFTGSGMQPLVSYLLGEQHPGGNRVANSQTCLRAEDIEEVGDMCHTTFFEMLGNWSFGDYFKQEQLAWFFEFLTDVIGLDPQKLYVTCFISDETAGIAKDSETAEIWQKLFEQKGVDNKVVELGSKDNAAKVGMQEGRIFYYDASKNWWSRAGEPKDMPAGEPGGPDSEVFYEFTEVEHDKKFGDECHSNCGCGRFLEIGNSVFMQYLKQADGSFKPLPKQNVDFGGGLERIVAAKANDPDIFKIDLLWPIIKKLQDISKKDYQEHTQAMRVIADHLRAATFLAVDGVVPSNKVQGYVMRRLMRRAIRYALELGIEQGLCEQIAPVIIDIYQDTYPEAKQARDKVVEVLAKEEKAFRQTLQKGLRLLQQLVTRSHGINLREADLVSAPGDKLTGETAFKLYDTYGFPIELTLEEASKLDLGVSSCIERFNELMEEQRERSRTAAKGTFKGGLADNSELTTKYHTVAHLLMQALRIVLGNDVSQRGSNITAERLRLDFSHTEKVTPEQLAEVEKIVNEQIAKDLPVTCSEQDTKEAITNGATGVFQDKYGDKVKVYTIGDFSKEICGGPHIDHTGQLGESADGGGKKFKITKEESSSAGVRRIKAILE
jgi:alanyl-tRNA synthetase